MSDDIAEPEQPELPLSIGDRLRQARENAGLSLAAVAEQTRIPRRHIEAIESNRLSDLPNGPYAIGFARSIARAVGFSEAEAAQAMRAELTHNDRATMQGNYSPSFEPADTARIPSKTLAWTAALIGVLLIAGYSVWRTSSDTMQSTSRGGETPTDAGERTAPTGNIDAQAPAANGPVTLRASGEVWFGLNDPATGRLVFYRTLRAGETYVVPEEQRSLQLRTSRAQDLQLVVGSRTLPPLGPPDTLVKGVALDAASLAARSAAAPAAPTGQAAVTPNAAPR